MNSANKTSTKLKSPRGSTSKALANLFRNRRIECGLDLASIAVQASVALESVVQLEAKPQLVPLADLYAVANVLNLEPGQVLDLLHSAMRS